MEYQDKMLKCIDCGTDFVFTAGEQLFFHDKQFNWLNMRNQDSALAIFDAQAAHRPLAIHNQNQHANRASRNLCSKNLFAVIGVCAKRDPAA